ncbi:MAG TPA: TetR family transcriptional regulator [Rhodospirillaceae bacterium]|nr:TetR family transcriptional regulator [Magnetovibrio sp.]HBT41237.1 TetR family transcriptional regulator [Rhodospirillaceae bacterium]HCS71295.1 TetR family transcriptional regulator [Rhodospirillaceae bacterium]|tara:strand:- start:7964 stop:8572 length:609 start_codon:yes stop_codon:yes gene_type:complete
MSRAYKPDETRRQILEAAYGVIHRHGFQAAGLTDILALTGVTKGAMYHHFPNKMALGYAVVDEMVKDYLEDWWLAPLEVEGDDDPLAAIARTIQNNMTGRVPDIHLLGCPLNNLAQEMSPIDGGFRQRVEELYRAWRRRLSRALTRGQHSGKVNATADTDEAATLIVAAIQGAFSQTKSAQSMAPFHDCMAGLNRYLMGLRP